MAEVSATSTWGLQTSSSFSFDSPRSEFRTGSTRPPARHLVGTPDKVEGDGYLPTTHAALCAVEELSRVGIMNASVLLHVLDECERDLTGEAPNAGIFSFSKTAIRVSATLRDVLRLE